MTDKITPPNGMISISEFSSIKGIPEEKIIDMIKDGFYIGRTVNDEWFVNSSDELPTSESSDSKTQHRFQSDLNAAQNAVTVGGVLSVLSTLVHVICLVAVFIFASKMNESSGITVVIGSLGVLLSWAITYSLLSIVVTNALTAKHNIFQSSKSV